MRTFEHLPGYRLPLSKLRIAGLKKHRGKMGKKTKTEIVVERDQVLVIRNLEAGGPEWCSACGEEARMVTVDEAAAIAQVSARTIHHWVDDGRAHFRETAGGQLFICLNSLLK